MTTPDQFTRWLCAMCGEPGIDSWNKALHDGINWQGDYPNPAVFGDDCQSCGHPVAVAYTLPGEAPTAIYGPGFNDYSEEPEAMDALQLDPASGTPLLPSTTRDADWSGGCLAAKGQLQ